MDVIKKEYRIKELHLENGNIQFIPQWSKGTISDLGWYNLQEAWSEGYSSVKIKDIIRDSYDDALYAIDKDKENQIKIIKEIIHKL